MSVRTWKPFAAGILNLIGGGFYLLFFFLTPPGISIELDILTFILGIWAMVGGISAIRYKNKGTAMSGSIANFLCWLYFLLFISTDIGALILTLMAFVAILLVAFSTEEFGKAPNNG